MGKVEEKKPEERTEPEAGTPVDATPGHRLWTPPEAAKQKPADKPEMPKAEAKPEPKKAEAKPIKLVKIHGSHTVGEVVHVHGTVNGEARVVQLHRNELAKHEEVEARQQAAARHLAAGVPERLEVEDPWGIRGAVRLP